MDFDKENQLRGLTIIGKQPNLKKIEIIKKYMEASIPFPSQVFDTLNDEGCFNYQFNTSEGLIKSSEIVAATNDMEQVWYLSPVGERRLFDLEDLKQSELMSRKHIETSIESNNSVIATNESVIATNKSVIDTNENIIQLNKSIKRTNNATILNICITILITSLVGYISWMSYNKDQTKYKQEERWHNEDRKELKKRIDSDSQLILKITRLETFIDSLKKSK